VVKLLRTDTTLDLSQKARVVRNPKSQARTIYTPDMCARTMFTSRSLAKQKHSACNRIRGKSAGALILRRVGVASINSKSYHPVPAKRQNARFGGEKSSRAATNPTQEGSWPFSCHFPVGRPGCACMDQRSLPRQNGAGNHLRTLFTAWNDKYSHCGCQ